MSRIYSELTDLTKTKISHATKGKVKSEAHKQAISKAMKEYWQTIPYKNKKDMNIINE